MTDPFAELAALLVIAAVVAAIAVRLRQPVLIAYIVVGIAVGPAGFDLVKSHDILVFHHDDGAIRPLIPDFIDMGIDVLNPVQWRCDGMEQAGLARDFGERVCFHGGVDNQQTLPHGTVADVRAEAKWLVETLASDETGFILAPCHNVQPNTPPENVVAMYEAARAYGTFDGR